VFPNPPLVSIVIPVFDGERLIGRTLDSARAQTYEPIEIIVVDDGSTDQSAAIAAAMAAHDQRIQLIKQENRGVAAARNLGVKIGKGSLIAPLDADDLWHRDKLARQVAVMQASPKVGLVYGWAVEIDDNDYVIPPVRNGSTAEGNVFLELVSKAGIIDSGSNPLIRRSCSKCSIGAKATGTKPTRQCADRSA
jgi:glycosyltransferase involved in cell wall biosynthesis